MSGTVGKAKKEIGGKNTLLDLGIAAGIPLLGLGIGGLAGGGLGSLFGGAEAAGAGAAGAAGTGLEAGSLDALAATGNLAGTIPAAAGGVDAAGAAAAGLGISDLAGGGGGVAGGITDTSGLDAFASAAPPGAIPAPAVAPGAASVAAPPGVAAVADPTGVASGIDLETGNATGGFNAFDAAAGAGTSAAPAAGGTSLTDLVTNPLGSLKDLASAPLKNPLGTVVAAGGLGYDVLKGQQQSAAVKNLEGQAAAQGAQGAQLASYLSSGTLPPGLQAGLDQATASAIASAKANAAANGQSTDPTKNTVLAQQIQAIQEAATASSGQIAETLLQAGVSESGLADNLYTTLANIDATQTQNTIKALASLSAALSGKTPGIALGGTGLSITG